MRGEIKMKNHWKLLLSTLLLALVFAFTACGGGNDGDSENGTTDEPVTGVREEAPERDLGGMQINIANWWTDECTETIEPESFAQRARWDDRRDQEELYNFRMRYVRYGSWHDVRDDLQQQLLAEDRNFQMWIVEPTWFATNHSQGLFAPIPMHHFDDDYGIEWSHSLIENTMRDGAAHGFAHGVEMAGGVYFNMRLLEESGLARDLPFTLQRDNNWTWDTFMEMARPLSVDRTGDGIPDTWAITSFHQEVLAHALASNGASYAVVNPATGRFENSTNTDAFREAIEFSVNLRDEMLAMHEDDVGGAWDVFIQMFNDGQGAIRVAANYVAGNIFPVLADDWGFVAFPRGPRAESGVHMAWVSQNINVIPHFYSDEEIDNMMFAMQRWIRPLPDDDPDDWMEDAFTNHRDPRSVTETMVNFTRNPEFQGLPAHLMMPGLGHTLSENFAWRVWVGNDPSVIIEEAQQYWDAFLDRVNNLGS
jgi:hypothetical protein